ncbi:MAG TPA: uroporphyrinogen decarboxylase family protein [Phycisphaerae bacterium]|nr:uroporphyrinogen decarboxylase family protein [Phycisphaerae bacterium]HOJ72607.1 uroporphyrinogen decarboxylase family protein [Phycisphaerae bacterium]HOM49732.1 uroporphyrinogen decarboxylase family protein [Phycisphaerae bacterium]HON64976.1 uroporphyrinogen decarboxylase family protein [Phycisphaerae bacterium]HPP25101.1 uroporphyrinogen decarboxylase family protein [Phycisphaerae bacterium]
MSGKTLLLNALRNQSTSRPAWVPFVGVHGGKIIGATAQNYLRSAELIIRGLTRAFELYRPDGLPIVFDLQLEAEVLGCQLRWSDETPPAVTSHPLSSGTDLDGLPSFDTGKRRYPVVAEAMKTIKRQIGEEVALYGLITGPFTLALHLMGTNIFLEMFNNPDLVKRVVDFCAGVGCKAADFYIDQGADVVAVVDPMTSQISPKHFQEFVTAPVNVVFDHIREKGALSSLFVCGNATRNLENMCATRCDNVSVDENIDLARLGEMARAAGKSFGGNLKLTTVLLLGDEAAARRDALRCIDIGGTQGFILAPGCDLPYATPEANLQAVAHMVHDEYQRNVARAATQVDSAESFDDIQLPDYSHEDRVIVDVITLDSASCAPCQYMVAAVERAAQKFGDRVVVNEHKITTRSGLGHMAKLGVGQIPTICIDGEVKFPSIIPDITTLIEALEEKIKAKQ